MHPQIVEQWRNNPSKFLVVKLKFKSGSAWIADATAALRGTRASKVPGEPDSRILSIDGWIAARMARTLEEIHLAGELGFEWMRQNDSRVTIAPIRSNGALAKRFRKLETMRRASELIVVEVPLMHGADQSHGVFRELVARFGGLVGRPAFYSQHGRERLLIAMPAEPNYSRELLNRLAALPNLRGVLSLELYEVKQFSELVREDASWIFRAHEKPEPLQLGSVDELLDSSTMRFSLLELDDRVSKPSPAVENEQDATWVRFSLLELD